MWRPWGLLGLAATFALLGGCASTPPEEDPVTIKLNDLDRRLERLERVISNQSLLELSQQVQALQAEMRSIRGSLEQVEHSSAELKAQQRSLYGDLDRRIGSLQNTPAVATPPPGSSSALPVPGGSDRANYQAAFDALKGGQYDRAATGFQQFLAAFPDSSLADNARYWLGECYYVTHRYDEGLKLFQEVAGKPGSPKRADALLKIGYTQYELKNWRPAREALERVKRDFPNSSAAAEAAARLEKMGTEGH